MFLIGNPLLHSDYLNLRPRTPNRPRYTPTFARDCVS